MDRLDTGWIGDRCAALGLIVSLGACAIGDRAESVYLRQHRAAAALAETIALKEDQDPQLAAILYAAEADLGEACAPLRRAGYLRLQGEEIDSDLEWAIVHSLEACAAKTAQMEELLWRASPDIAAFFLPPPAATSSQVPRLTLSP